LNLAFFTLVALRFEWLEEETFVPAADVYTARGEKMILEPFEKTDCFDGEIKVVRIF